MVPLVRDTVFHRLLNFMSIPLGFLLPTSFSFRPGPYPVPLCLAPGSFLFVPPGHAIWPQANGSSQRLFLGYQFFAMYAVSSWFMSLDSFLSPVRCLFAAIRCVFLAVAWDKSLVTAAGAFGCFHFPP